MRGPFVPPCCVLAFIGNLSSSCQVMPHHLFEVISVRGTVPWLVFSVRVLESGKESLCMSLAI